MVGDGSEPAHRDGGRAPLPPASDDEPLSRPADPDDEPPSRPADPDDEPLPLPADPDDGRPLEERAAGQMGPGIARRQGIDPTLLTAAIFVLLGFTPVAWSQAVLGFGYFGPLEVPAILAMVGVLFAFIAVLRAVDTEDVPLRTQALIAAAAGLLRLFIVPFF